MSVCTWRGVPGQVHPLGPGTPPQANTLRTRYTPSDQVHLQDQVHPRADTLRPGSPLGPGTPSRTRYTPWEQTQTQDQVHPQGDTTLGPGTPPPTTEHAGRHSQHVHSPHPTEILFTLLIPLIPVPCYLETSR